MRYSYVLLVMHSLSDSHRYNYDKTETQIVTNNFRTSLTKLLIQSRIFTKSMDGRIR